MAEPMTNEVKFYLRLYGSCFIIFIIALIAILNGGNLFDYSPPPATNEAIQAEKSYLDNKISELKKVVEAEKDSGFINSYNSQKLAEMLNKSTCDDLIDTWRPKIGNNVDYKVSCEDSLVSGNNDSPSITGITLSTVVKEDGYEFLSPQEIILKRGLTVEEYKNALTHEVYHWVLNSWSHDKQKRFMDTFKVKSFSEGDYLNHLGEKWAYSGTHCEGFTSEPNYFSDCSLIDLWLSTP